MRCNFHVVWDEDSRIWYDARDMFFGHNFQERDKEGALALCAKSKHPDAVFFCSMFSGKLGQTQYLTWDFVQRRFSIYDHDARALCYSGLHNEQESVLKAAEMGDAFACAFVARFGLGDLSLKRRTELALLSCEKGERDGFSSIAELQKSLGFALQAANMGCIDCCKQVANQFSTNEPSRYTWLSKIAASRKRGCQEPFLCEIGFQMRRLEYGHDVPSVLFEMGRQLNGQVDLEEGEIFGSSQGFADRKEGALAAVQFYLFQKECYQKAVFTFALIARRVGVVKDVRLIISRKIWESRKEAKYKYK